MRIASPWVNRVYVTLMFLALVLAATYVFFPFYVARITHTRIQYFAYLFAVFIPFGFLFTPATKKAALSNKIPWYDWLFAVLSFGCFIWVGIYGYEAQIKGWSMTPPLYVSIIGVIVWILTMEASRRTGGILFVGVITAIAFLPYYGFLLPEPFTVHQHPLLRTPAFYLLDEQAVFGPPVKVLCQILIGYMMFGAILQWMGGGVYLIKLAVIFVGGFRGAIGKVAVVSSAIFGMFNGSGVSNVVTTGAVTIPAMKKSGYPSYYSAAIETVSSTGGIILPPVMGANAFIMAELTNLSYAYIAMSAIVPGLLYYLAVFVQSDLQAVNLGLSPIPKEERTEITWRMLLEGVDFVIAGAVLAYVIFGPMLPAQAPFYGLLPLIIGGIIKKKITLKTISEMIGVVGKLMVNMSGLFLALGYVTGGILFTGLGLNISNLIFGMGSANLVVILLLGGLVPIVMGMGILTNAVYIIVAITLAPILTKMGIHIMAAHLFIMYYANLGGITPPVGVTYITAARIADAPPMKVGWQSMRLGIVMAIIPIYFVQNPALLFLGSFQEMLVDLVYAFIIVVLLSIGFEQRMYFIGKITIWEAMVCILTGFLLTIFASSEWRFLGLIVTAGLVGYWMVKARFRAMVAGKKGLDAQGS